MEFPQLLRLELHLLPSPADANQQAKKTRPYKKLANSENWAVCQLGPSNKP